MHGMKLLVCSLLEMKLQSLPEFVSKACANFSSILDEMWRMETHKYIKALLIPLSLSLDQFTQFTSQPVRTVLPVSPIRTALPVSQLNQSETLHQFHLWTNQSSFVTLTFQPIRTVVLALSPPNQPEQLCHLRYMPQPIRTGLSVSPLKFNMSTPLWSQGFRSV